MKKQGISAILFSLVLTAVFPVDIQKDIIEKGSRLVGTPYRFGGTTPSGFDCSGLVNYLYKPHVPSLPRSASSMADFGITVPIKEIAMGDLVFYATGADPYDITHVGIYIGQKTLIQSVSDGPERGVILTDLDEKYWKDRFKWVKRVFPRLLKSEVQTINTNFTKGSYEGAAADYEPEGIGLMNLKNGDVYEGQFHNGLFNGEGKYYYSNGDIYTGVFLDGREAGGDIIRSDGSRYSAYRDSSGTLIINRKVDNSGDRTNYLLEVPTNWDDWLDREMALFEASMKADRDAVQSEAERFEEWKKTH